MKGLSTATEAAPVSGWVVKPINDLAAFEKGHVVATQSHSGQGFIPYIGADSLGGIYSQFTNDKATVTCEPSDVLMLWDGERSGLCASGLKGAISSTVARLRPRDAVHGRFLYYQLAQHFDWIQARRTGTGVPHVPQDLGTLLCVPIPRLQSEQSRIAIVLDTASEAIAKTEAVIAKLRQVHTGLLHNLLTRGVDIHGQLREPIAHPEQFQDSPLGRIPKQWDCRPLPAFAKWQNGQPFPSSQYCDRGIRLLRPGNLPATEFVSWDTLETCLPETWVASAREFLVCGDELVMNLTAQSLEDGFLGRVCMTRPNEVCLLNQRLARFRAVGVHLQFLFWCLRGPHFRKQMNRIPQGTKVQHLYNRDLELALVAVPKNVDEQVAIVDVLCASAKQIEATSREVGKLRLLKSGLMTDLLTGRVRVSKTLEESP